MGKKIKKAVRLADYKEIVETLFQERELKPFEAGKGQGQE